MRRSGSFREKCAWPVEFGLIINGLEERRRTERERERETEKEREREREKERERQIDRERERDILYIWGCLFNSFHEQ